MTQYACSSVTAFVPPGGVCEGHSKGPKDTNLSVDCPVCEPILAADHRFWASSLDEVPLTAAEEKMLGAQSREIEMQRVADAVADREFLHRQSAGRAQ